MATLKNNIDYLTDDTSNLAKNYLKLFGLKQSERLAVLLGILSTIFIISTLLLIVIVFSSFVLAGWLNEILANDYWGFFIVSGLYLIVVAILLLNVKKTGNPLFVNLFVRFVLPLLNIETNQKKNLEGLNIESENVRDKIEGDKKVFIAHSQLLRYTILEDLLKEVTQMFKSNKTSKTKDKPAPSKQRTSTAKDDKV